MIPQPSLTSAPGTNDQSESGATASDLESKHVVFLVNFVAPNLIAVMREFAARVGRLTILSSVEMESNRDWNSDWGDLNVVVQNTWTITRHPVHPSGYKEVNFIHIPLDTLHQLRRLRPDAIVSLELGARSIMSSLHSRFLSHKTAHVIAVYASQRSEAGRGPIRRWLRRRLLKHADAITTNGPSCTRLLSSYGAKLNRVLPWNYAADPRKIYHGELPQKNDRNHLKLLTVGQLSERKGMIPAAIELAKWATNNPAIQIQWNVVGAGPLQADLQAEPRPGNLQLVMHGHCDPKHIIDQYRDNDLLLFPTMADEWGLVVDEALQSGLPVIGSCHSQAAATLIEDRMGGWTYDPEQEGALSAVLDDLINLSQHSYEQMPADARRVAVKRTPAASAIQLVQAVRFAMTARGLLPETPGTASSRKSSCEVSSS